MGLKAFHIVFILASGVLTTWFGLWCLSEFPAGSGWFFAGIASFGATVGLAAYLSWVLKKLRNVGYIALAATVALYSDRALACAVCFGDPNSAMVQSVNAAMSFFLGLVAFMLAAFAGTFFYWRSRARALSR